jgi:ABC-type sugar transport system substrate-binding protein
VLLLAALAASGFAAAAVVGSLKGWTNPTLGVVFATGLVEALVAVGLGVKVVMSDDKRMKLFVPGVALAALATASLAGIFLLSGSI